MAVVYKGALATESREWNYSQDEGMQETRRCHGHPNTVRSWAYNLKDDGYDITISTGGPYWDALAIRTKPYPTSPFVERWTLTTHSKEIQFLRERTPKSKLFSQGGFVVH